MSPQKSFFANCSSSVEQRAPISILVEATFVGFYGRRQEELRVKLPENTGNDKLGKSPSLLLLLLRDGGNSYNGHQELRLWQLGEHEQEESFYSRFGCHRILQQAQLMWNRPQATSSHYGLGINQLFFWKQGGRQVTALQVPSPPSFSQHSLSLIPIIAQDTTEDSSIANIFQR